MKQTEFEEMLVTFRQLGAWLQAQADALTTAFQVAWAGIKPSVRAWLAEYERVVATGQEDDLAPAARDLYAQLKPLIETQDARDATED